MKLYLDGVACTGKTSIIKKLKRDGYSVGLLDFYEFRVENGPDCDSFYPSWYSSREKLYDVVDRSPLSPVLYRVIHNKDAEFSSIIPLLKPVDGTILVFTTAPGQEQHVVDAMKARNNGIDVLEVDYVKRQNKIFKEFIQHFNLPSIEVGYKDGIFQPPQIESVVKFLE